MSTNERPWYFWPLIAFVAGLLIGLVVLGWNVWPVTWTNATVQDLRPELRQQYVSMVAESFAQTRNLEVARQRLAGWPQEALAELLSETQTVLVARDPGAAANVQLLSVSLGAAATTPGTAAGQGQPSAAATAATGGAAAAETSRLRQICTAGIFVLLALGALALIFYLFRRWRAAREAPESEALAPDYSPLMPSSPAAVAAEQEKARPLAAQPYDWEDRVAPATSVASPGVRPARERDDDGVEPPFVLTSTSRPVGPLPTTPQPSEPLGVKMPPASPVPSAKSTAGLQTVAENTAMYQMGEPDYDEAFDINDPVDGYMGQCGLQLIEPFGRERDQAVALQVWLWDSSDPDTQTLVLMSEGAYRDTALRSQYAGEHQAMQVRPGTEFELASHDLLLRGRVEKVSYAEIEPVRGVFADLLVKLTVYRRS